MNVEEIYAKLKELPEPALGAEVWSEYGSLGFGEEEMEHLLDLASDFYLKREQSDEESAVSIHAWRALAESGDAGLLPEFLTLSIGCDDIADEWFAKDFPKMLGKLGMAAWPELLDAVRSTPEYPCLAHAMLEGAPQMVRNVEDRVRVIGSIVEFFDYEPFQRSDRAFVVAALVELKAVKKLEVIQKQFAENRVSVEVVGDIEEVEIALGLRAKRDTPRKDFFKEEVRLAEKEKKELAGSFPDGGSLEEKLQYFLLRYGSEDSIRGVDQLNGFLLALCVSGVRMSNLERADCIWDPVEGEADARPKFENKKEGQRWLECVREYCQQIDRGMSDGSYQAHVSIWPDAKDSMDPEAPYFTPWLEGFAMGELLFSFSRAGGKWEENPLALLMERVFEEEEAGMRLLEDRDDNPIFDFMEAIQARYANREVRDFVPYSS
ncbi:MAG: UPF0149 family protein [Roseibacillus sp.]